ncbi:histidine kinase [Burkholderia sp. JP2-270]|uniref:PAS domain-containing protein n=1 Tax=Burkholderia sp. JP2-270 TaxID=2217913 RepID=UPI000DA36BF5|nr:PAS domain-containing protein [Burkholderia sp. JP2-270]AWV05077.1 histidine kinase [Burkholderia sp. JP2-270]
MTQDTTTVPNPELRILLLEDTPEEAELIRRALTRASIAFVATRAGNRSEFISSLQAFRPDIVLSDYNLPDLNGREALAIVQQYDRTVPVVIVTGALVDDEAVALIKAGANDYVLKDRLARLGPAVRRALAEGEQLRHREAAERALAASEERFQLAVSGATAGLWDWNPRTDAVYFSPHFKEIMGYADHDLPNERRALFDAIHTDDIGLVTGALKAHLEHRGAYDVEYRVSTKSGDVRWIQSRGHALWNESGEPYRMVGWIMDVTERKRSEEALRLSSEELRRLSAHIQHIREEEKARIARELHDDLGQHLTALKMAVASVDDNLKGIAPRLPDGDLHGVRALIDQLIDSVRRIASDLRPVMLDDLGLIPAIEWLTTEFSARYHVPVIRHIDGGEIAFNRESGIEVFRMVQEALTNVARHSGATQVVLDIVRDDPHCIVRIADNGRGVTRETSPSRRSFGLIGMRERAALLGGEIRIRTEPGSGFELTAILPLAALEAGE